MGQETPARKACDLCYRRKIKCNGEKPRCSNCVNYSTDCTFAAASRKAAKKRQLNATEESAMRTQVDSLRSQLRNAQNKINELEKSLQSSTQFAAFDSVEKGEDVGRADRGANDRKWEFPPLQVTLPIIQEYLSSINSVLPLFHHGHLIKAVEQWYRSPNIRDSTTWALINTVFALAHCFGTQGGTKIPGNQALYLNRVQSVMAELISKDADLAIVQVMLGMAMVFQANLDHKPVPVFVSTALHLAHTLRLHIRDSYGAVDPATSLQRNRVFWMAYVLDRDVSIRTGRAPIHRDDDIALDLPPLEPDHDQGGFIFAADGSMKVNYFRLRVQIAHMQGKIYDSLYSVAAQHASFEERGERTLEMLQMLDSWKHDIPTQFQPSTLTQADPLGLSSYCCVLYANSLVCRFLVSRASSWDAQWLDLLEEYDSDDEAKRNQQVAHLPHGWLTLLDESRHFMALFAVAATINNPFVCSYSCAYISSLVCLKAQSVFSPHHEFAESDSRLIDAGMRYLDQMADQTGMSMLQRISNVCRSLDKRSRILVS